MSSDVDNDSYCPEDDDSDGQSASARCEQSSSARNNADAARPQKASEVPAAASAYGQELADTHRDRYDRKDPSVR
eukprot:5595288-Pleurochrysis_carterae.AAC.1